jgi:hypothetical protein
MTDDGQGRITGAKRARTAAIRTIARETGHNERHLNNRRITIAGTPLEDLAAKALALAYD